MRTEIKNEFPNLIVYLEEQAGLTTAGVINSLKTILCKISKTEPKWLDDLGLLSHERNGDRLRHFCEYYMSSGEPNRKVVEEHLGLFQASLLKFCAKFFGIADRPMLGNLKKIESVPVEEVVSHMKQPSTREICESLSRASRDADRVADKLIEAINDIPEDYKITIYVDMGVKFAYSVSSLEKAREHASAIIKEGYRHTPEGSNELTWYPPHRISKIIIPNDDESTNDK